MQTEVPYLCHPLAVGSIVMEAGGTPSEIVAGLLHDTAEDVKQPGVSGEDVLRHIEARYGAQAAHIVRACSDTLPTGEGGSKPPWRRRKETYLEHLRTCDAPTLLVSAADKLHNLRSTLADWHTIGDAVFDRFNTGEGHTREQRRTETLWYYRALLEVYVDSRAAPDDRRDRITRELAAILTEFDRGASTAK